MKKMNKKVGIIVSSIATIAVCSSMVVGSTYALFTSESEVNIAVTSANVEVSASIENVKSYTYGYEAGAENATLVEGNLATLVGNELSLNNVLPGDKVEFDIVIKNESTVSVLYKTNIECTEGEVLMSALKFTVGETDYSGLKSYSSAWETLSVDTKTQTVHVVLELPLEAGNEYKNLSTKIAYSVSAVQGNTHGSGEASTEYYLKVNSAAELKAALLKGGSYTLVNDLTIDTEFAIGKNDVNLDLGGHTITSTYVSPEDNKIHSVIKVNAYGYNGVGAGIKATISNGTIIANTSCITCSGDTSVITLNNVTAITKIGSEVVYASYGDKCIIESGTYAADGYVLNSDFSINYLVDVENNTLTDANGVKTQYESITLEYKEDLGGVVVLVDGEILQNGKGVGIVNRYLINSRGGDGSAVIVKGGTYKNFNPANNLAEGKPTNLVPEGYSVVCTQDEVGNYWFTVVAD